MTDSDEHSLVLAAIQGDLDSFGLLCSRYYPVMTALAYAVVGDHHYAEDVVQEGFARALEKLSGLKQPEKFAPWLAAICRNLARDKVRKHAKFVATGNLTDVPDPAVRSTVLRDQCVRNAIDKLDPDHRELIVMRFYNHLSYQQITSVTGLSKAAINSRLYRAKEKLARQLRRESILDDE